MNLEQAKQAVASNADAIVATAACQASGGGFDKASAIVRMLLIADPEHAEAWHLLGAICFRTRNPLGAAVCLERCLELAPDHGPANAMYGELALRSGAPRPAARHLAAALANESTLSPRLRTWVTLLAQRCPATA